MMCNVLARLAHLTQQRHEVSAHAVLQNEPQVVGGLIPAVSCSCRQASACCRKGSSKATAEVQAYACVCVMVCSVAAQLLKTWTVAYYMQTMLLQGMVVLCLVPPHCCLCAASAEHCCCCISAILTTQQLRPMLQAAAVDCWH
jgi:hypothetical protein